MSEKTRRGPKPRSEDKIRQKSIQIMVLPAEREAIEQMAIEAGESISTFCRTSILKLIRRDKSK
jgi:hypothetical protein